MKRRITEFIVLFLSCIFINIASAQALKYDYIDSFFMQKMTEEGKDKKFANLVNEARLYSLNEDTLKKALELYEQIINDYPEYFITITVQHSLFGLCNRLYMLTDDNLFREKAISTAHKGIDSITRILSSGVESEFLEWLKNEFIVTLLRYEKAIPQSQIGEAKDFYLLSLSDRITSGLLSHSYLRLAQVYIYERDISQAMVYVNKGLELADRLENKREKASFLFMGTIAMKVSGNKEKADEFYQRLIEISPDRKQLIDKRLSTSALLK